MSFKFSCKYSIHDLWNKKWNKFDQKFLKFCLRFVLFICIIVCRRKSFLNGKSFEMNFAISYSLLNLKTSTSETSKAKTHPIKVQFRSSMSNITKGLPKIHQNNCIYYCLYHTKETKEIIWQGSMVTLIPISSIAKMALSTSTKV